MSLPRILQQLRDHSAAFNAHGASAAAEAGRLILRDANGRAKVAPPLNNDEIALKQTVLDGDAAALAAANVNIAAGDAATLAAAKAHANSRITAPNWWTWRLIEFRGNDTNPINLNNEPGYHFDFWPTVDGYIQAHIGGWAGSWGSLYYTPMRRLPSGEYELHFADFIYKFGLGAVKQGGQNDMTLPCAFVPAGQGMRIWMDGNWTRLALSITAYDAM
jgi:hypothetical protein